MASQWLGDTTYSMYPKWARRCDTTHFKLCRTRSVVEQRATMVQAEGETCSHRSGMSTPTDRMSTTRHSSVTDLKYSDIHTNTGALLSLDYGIVLLARVRPSTEEDFAQVLIPVALSYDTFLCKLCVALGIEHGSVRKVVKLPDILIRTTEDVVRLQQQDKLEIRVRRVNPWLQSAKGGVDWVTSFARVAGTALLFGALAIILARQQMILNKFDANEPTDSENQPPNLLLTKLASVKRAVDKTITDLSRLQADQTQAIALLHQLSQHTSTMPVETLEARLAAVETSCAVVGEVEASRRKGLEGQLAKKLEGYERSMQTLTDRIKEVSKITATVKAALYDSD